MRRKSHVIFLKQDDGVDKIPCTRCRRREPLFPVVEAAAPDAHFLAEQLYRKFSAKLQDHLVFLLLNGIKTFSAPSPFTS
jgi:hypothetical protein